MDDLANTYIFYTCKLMHTHFSIRLALLKSLLQCRTLLDKHMYSLYIYTDKNLKRVAM